MLARPARLFASISTREKKLHESFIYEKLFLPAVVRYSKTFSILTFMFRSQGNSLSLSLTSPAKKDGIKAEKLLSNSGNYNFGIIKSSFDIFSPLSCCFLMEQREEKCKLLRSTSRKSRKVCEMMGGTG